MDEDLLAEARRAQERLIDAEQDAEVARAEFHRAVRRLHLHGSSLRELAAALGLSHQRVHQIVESAGGSRRQLRAKPVRPGPQLTCRFCGKDQTEVRKLIAGPGVYICDECVDVVQAVLGSGEAASTPAGDVTPVPEGEHSTRMPCSFCGKYRHQVPGMAASSGQTDRNVPATICTECLALCEEIITEEFA